MARIAQRTVDQRDIVLIFGQDGDGNTLMPVQMRSLRRLPKPSWSADSVKDG
jgi:hypothetical protein